MRVWKFVGLILVFFGLASCRQNNAPAKAGPEAVNIDGLKVSPANFKLLLENEQVRVLEYTLPPGATDTPHTHPPKASYVVSGGKIKVYTDAGDQLVFDEKTGTADWGDYVGKHKVENIGSTPVVIVLTEIKALQKN